MTRKGFWFLVVALIVAVSFSCKETAPEPAAGAKAADQGQAETAVAKVGALTVTRHEFEIAYKYLPEQAAPIIREKGPGFLLDKLVELDLGYLEALSEGMDKDPELREQADKLVRQFYFQQLLKKSMPKEFDVSDADAQTYYDQHKDEFKGSERAKAMHIIVGDEKAAAEVKKEVKSGAKFAELVQKYSAEPQKDKTGGNLGWFDQGQMLPEIDKAVFSAKKGEVVGPVKTQYGYHLIYIEDMKPAGAKSFDEVKDELKKQLQQTKAEEWHTQWVEGLKKKFPVTKFPENMPDTTK
jgi:peptidyl-prolyl cis-trans isomerase C